jgi:hypothetical protein
MSVRRLIRREGLLCGPSGCPIQSLDLLWQTKPCRLEVREVVLPFSVVPLTFARKVGAKNGTPKPHHIKKVVTCYPRLDSAALAKACACVRLRLFLMLTSLVLCR